MILVVVNIVEVLIKKNHCESSVQMIGQPKERSCIASNDGMSLLLMSGRAQPWSFCSLVALIFSDFQQCI